MSVTPADCLACLPLLQQIAQRVYQRIGCGSHGISQEELVNVGWLYLPHILKSYRPDKGKLFSYAYTALRRLFQSHLRKTLCPVELSSTFLRRRQRRGERFRPQTHLLSSLTVPPPSLRRLELAELAERVQQALQHLTPAPRRLLEERFGLGIYAGTEPPRLADMARAGGLTRAAQHARYKSALKQLRDQLGDLAYWLEETS